MYAKECGRELPYNTSFPTVFHNLHKKIRISGREKVEEKRLPLREMLCYNPPCRRNGNGRREGAAGISPLDRAGRK